MSSTQKTNITVETTVHAPIIKVWECWTTPDHITHWNNASDDWYTPNAENDMQQGGRFVYRMEAKDGSVGFDFGGVYESIKPNEAIAYILDDGRKVQIKFTDNGETTHVEETFEAEETNPVEMQKQGWQNILDNFTKYTEGKVQG